ncbi:hypothetical protein [Gordonia terrae]|uniref:hypothetical protein n=1 Tax=Gordonia terrae TaxID=2055 RepID=UPI003F6C3130
MTGSSRGAEVGAERQARRDLRDALDDLHAVEVDAGLRRRPPRRWSVLAIVAMVVALVLAGTTLTLWSKAGDRYTDAELEAAAAERVAVLVAPDSRDTRRAQKILAGATGAFYDEFAQSADSYSRFVDANGAVAESSVDATGVSSRNGDTATVLVAATVVFAPTDPPTTDPRAVERSTGNVSGDVRRFRLRVLVTPDAGTLKLGAVQYLP